MSFSKSKITLSVFSFLLALGLSLSLQTLLAAWAPPTADPPSDNVPAPITEGTAGSNQIINGDLGVAGDFLVGADAFYVDQTNGRVGIGTTGPNAKLHILDSSVGPNLMYLENSNSDATPANLFFYKNTASPAVNDNIGQILFYGKDSGANVQSYGQITVLSTDVTDTTEDSKMIFATTKAGTVTDTLTLDSGNVGIGTTGPRAKLQLQQTSAGTHADLLALNNPGTTEGSGTAIYMGYQDAGLGFYGARIFQQGVPAGILSSDLLLQVHGTTMDNADSSWITGLMVQRTTGNVGIGTTNPGAKLEVAGGNTKFTSSQLLMSNGYGLLWGDTAIYGSDSSGSEYLRFDINSAPKLYIDNGGNVGIGTTPTSLFHVAKDQNAPTIIQFSNPNAGSSAEARIGLGSDTNTLYSYSYSSGYSTAKYAGAGRIVTSSGKLFLGSSNGDDIVMDGNGNVGIGIEPGTSRLKVDGIIEATGGIKFPDGTTQMTAAAGSGIPSGAVMAFNLSTCPSGWSELTSARGRYIVGLPSGGTLAAQVGTALSNTENRAVGKHSHYIGITQAWTGDAAKQLGIPAGTPATNVLTTDTGSVAGTNAPYIQLLVCQKD